MSYFKDVKTNKVFIKRPDAALMDRVKTGEVIELTEAQYEAYGDRAPVSDHFRKVYASVSSEDFTLFRRRCEAEKVPLDSALAMLVSQYAHGAVLTQVSKKAVERFRYDREVSAHSSAEVTTKE